jgi:hypothetical protein
MSFFLFLIIFSFTGCAHYFSKSFKEENILVKRDEQPSTICINFSSNFESPVSDYSEITSDSRDYKRTIELVKKKYSSMNINCKSSDRIDIIVSRKEEHTNASFFILSLGLIPDSFSLEYKVLAYNLRRNEILYQRKNSGKVVLSIFFVPVFFLHKSDYEIVFEEIDKYLQIHLNRQNNLR